MKIFKKDKATIVDGVYLEHDQIIKMEKISRVSSCLTFLSSRPYLANDLPKEAKADVKKMLALKAGYYNMFCSSVSVSNEIYQHDLSFIVFINSVDGWLELPYWYEHFLNEFCEFEVGDFHKDNMRSVLNKLDQEKINLLNLAGMTNEKAAAITIKIYNKHFVYKKPEIKKKKKKTLFHIFLFTVYFLLFMYFIVLPII